MVVPRPIPGLLVIEVHPLSELVVVGDISLTVVRVIVRVSGGSRCGNKREVVGGGWRPGCLRDSGEASHWIHGEYTVGCASASTVRLALRDGIA